VILALLLALQSHDWPQFRGPGGRGISTETDLPLAWSKDRGIRWSVELPGRGLSSPVIVGGRLFLTACTGPSQERLHVLAFDAKTGKPLWQRQFSATGSTQCNNKTSMAAPTPVADAGRVFALFATGDLAATDPDGNLLWYRSLVGDYPTIGNNVGMAASPVLHKDALLVAMENVGESFVGAIDARTGRNLWKRERPSKINWTTPFVAEHGGRTEALFQSPGGLTAFDPMTGSRLWSYDSGMATIPSPVSAEGVVIVPGGTSVALRPGRESAEKAWDSKAVNVGTPSPTIHDGKVYAVNDQGFVVCADLKTGAELWKARTKGKCSASPVIAGDRLYLVSDAGETTVLKLGAEAETLSVNALEDPMQASPAVWGGAIYLRSDKRLYCVGAP
jgi:outer membrane protein assembly factor BamB